jgi:hypothetical protein
MCQLILILKIGLCDRLFISFCVANLLMIKTFILDVIILPI